MKKNTDNQLIEDYIDGLLTGKRLRAFRKRLETDAEFAKAYNLRFKLAGLWQEADEYLETKKQFREIIENQNKSRFFRTRKAYYLIGLAASIVLLLGVYWILSKQNGGLPWNKKNQMAETADTIVFKMDKPKNLAEIKYTIQLISPENNQAFKRGDTIGFRWKSAVDTAKIEMLIQHRSNKAVVFQVKDYPKDYIYVATGNLVPGEYEWTVRDTANRRFFTIKVR